MERNKCCQSRVLSTGPNSRLLSLRNAVLERSGFVVVSASHVRNILQLMETEHFDVVIVGHSFSFTDQQAIARMAPCPVIVLFTGPNRPQWTQAATCDAWLPEELVHVTVAVIEAQSETLVESQEVPRVMRNQTRT